MWSVLSMNVPDVEPPKFTSGCPLNKQEFSDPLGTAVNLIWNDPAASDNSGGTVTLTSNPASGSLFLPGIHTVRITARDHEGNAASCVFFINVQSKIILCICICPLSPPSGCCVCTSNKVRAVYWNHCVCLSMYRASINTQMCA